MPPQAAARVGKEFFWCSFLFPMHQYFKETQCFLSNAILKPKNQSTCVNSNEYLYVKCNCEVIVDSTAEVGRSLMIFTSLTSHNSSIQKRLGILHLRIPYSYNRKVLCQRDLDGSRGKGDKTIFFYNIQELMLTVHW